MLLLNIFYPDEIDKYLQIIQDLNNPVYASFLLALTILFLSYVAIRYVIVPQQKRHFEEKRRLEHQNLLLTALFADLDPDPILRVDIHKKIIFMNPIAKSLGFDKYLNMHIESIFPLKDSDLADIIQNDRSIKNIYQVGERYYNIQINGIKYLNIAQIYFHDITELKLSQQHLMKSKEELKKLSNYLQTKIEEERQRIARELHDGIGQKLIFLQYAAQTFMIESAGNENISSFDEYQKIIDQTLVDLKVITSEIRPRVLEVGLVPALHSLVDFVKEKSKLKCQLTVIDVDDKFGKDFEICVYRIAQEAINNILKHAQAKEFNLQLYKKEDFIKLIISDDGKGFDFENAVNKGMGILNMKERAESVKGIMKVSSSPGDTVIVVEFPLENAYAKN